MPPKSRRDWSKPTTKVYERGKQYMELIPSVSRSSGLDKDGDALRDYETQEDYRDFIQTKLNEYWQRFPYYNNAEEDKKRDEVQGNILILFRKLREGLLSTKRTDAFALEVYETSLYLSIIFNSPAQTTSVISNLLPTMYQALPNHHSSLISTILLSSLHFIVAGYPSQSRYFEHLHSLPASFLPNHHPTKKWLRDLTQALRQRNYARLDDLTSRETCQRVLCHTDNSSPKDAEHRTFPADLALEALYFLVDSLRIKARETTWVVLRNAYRELSLPKPSGTHPAPTCEWLCHSLSLRPVRRKVSSGEIDSAMLLDAWMVSRHGHGDVRPKEGAEGRWMIVKPKA